jgi:signal transduction histidine kinase
MASSMLTLEDQIATTEQGRAYLEAISSGCNRLDKLMTALLDYFSATMLERKSAQPILAGEPLRLALANLDAAIRSSGAVIQTGDMPSVLAHPTALLLIFQNLLANAIKFSGSRAPHILISTERSGDFWQFTVKDDGIGFDPAQSLKIFDLFQRAHGDEHAGVGFGLALCQRLVSEHGGEIWAESEPGQGARFHFTIPAWFTTLAV